MGLRQRNVVYDTTLNTKITNSACFLHQLPRTRRCEFLELLDPRLDGAMTANLSCEGVSEMIWLLTRLRPNQRIADLRVRTYKDLLAVMRHTQGDAFGCAGV